MKLTVKYAPKIDREKLRVRINDEKRTTNNLEWYNYVEVKVKVNNSEKSIVCKLYGDDIPEIPSQDRKPSIIRINEPLRGKLGVKIDEEYEFKFKKRCAICAWWYFVRYHPDDTVIVSTWLGVIAFTIGFVATILGIISIVLALRLC